MTTTSTINRSLGSTATYFSRLFRQRFTSQCRDISTVPYLLRAQGTPLVHVYGLVETIHSKVANKVYGDRNHARASIRLARDGSAAAIATSKETGRSRGVVAMIDVSLTQNITSRPSFQGAPRLEMKPIKHNVKGEVFSEWQTQPRVVVYGGRRR